MQGMGRGPGCIKEEEEKEEKEKKADEGQEEGVRSRGRCYFCFPRQQHSLGTSKPARRCQAIHAWNKQVKWI